MTNLTDRLAAIRARVENATEGPWDAPETILGLPATTVFGPKRRHVLYHTGTHIDAEFVAHARTDLPTLLAAVEAVRELHQPEWHCGNPRHTNPDVGCPECAEYCTADGEQYPCPTVQALTDALEVQG